MKSIRFLAILLVVAFAATAVCAEPVKGRRAPGKIPGGKPGEVKPQWWGKAPGQNQKPVAAGTVQSVSPQSISVNTNQGGKTFVVNDKTRVMVRGQKATINDIKVGDQVLVRFAMQENTAVAIGIAVPKPSCRGQIVSIDNNMLVLRDPKASTECRVAVSDATKYGSRGYSGTLADLRVGYHAQATGTLSEGVLIADAVKFVPMVAKGTVIAVEGNLVTLKAVRQQTIPVVVDEKTVINISPRVAPDKKGTIADIKVGTPANIGFHAVQNGPGQLLWIDLLTGQ